MTEKNYIPFAAVEVLDVDQNDSAKLSVVQSAVASRHENAKIIYQDILLYPVYPIDLETSNYTRYDLLLRYGFEERGYLLEEAIPLMNAANMYGHLSPGGWRFAKPYRLDSGQHMTVTYEMDRDTVDTTEGYFSAILPCRRADNGQPYMLYGSNMDPTRRSGAFNGATMRAPSDTALYVEGVNYQFNLDSIGLLTRVGVQVYDGNGMEIIKTKPNNSAQFDRFGMLGLWPGFLMSGIELGEANGWKLPSKHPLILEMSNNGNSSADYEVMVIVRGSVEVA